MHYVAHSLFASEDIQIAGMRVALHCLLHLQRTVHATPHVGMADRQPYPHPHEPGSLPRQRFDNRCRQPAAMRTRAFPANSISIAGAAARSAPSPTGAINTGAKPWPTPISRRQR
jgi:hypothetical protein